MALFQKFYFTERGWSFSQAEQGGRATQCVEVVLRQDIHYVSIMKCGGGGCLKKSPFLQKVCLSGRL